jgi:pilus assembly protein Flp/PilA
MGNNEYKIKITLLIGSANAPLSLISYRQSWLLFVIQRRLEFRLGILTLCQTSLATLCALNRKEYPMHAFFTKLIKDEAGVTAIEYGLIAALIAVAAVTIMGTVGTRLSNTFGTVAASL